MEIIPNIKLAIEVCRRFFRVNLNYLKPRVKRETVIGIGLPVASFAFLIIFFNYVPNLLPFTLEGGSVAPFNGQLYGQTVGQLTASLVDTNLTILLGLYAMVAFAIHHDPNHNRTKFVYKLIPGCLLAVSSIICVFFAILVKSRLLVQIKYEKVDIEQLDPIFDLHLLALFISGLASLVILGLSVVPQRARQ